MEGVVAGTRARSARLYFVAFWVVTLVLVLNVVVAFVIEAFGVQKLRRETLQRLEDAAAARRAAAAAPPTSAGAGGKRGAPAATLAPPPPPGAVEAGLEDWRALLRASRVDFSR
jgi:hypothetical protein